MPKLLLRTPEAQKAYDEVCRARGASAPCPLCSARPIKTFRHWKLVNNEFPYNAIADTHHLLLPLRHIVERDITDEESRELVVIKQELFGQTYDYFLEPAPKNRSLPIHLHYHLLVLK